MYHSGCFAAAWVNPQQMSTPPHHRDQQLPAEMHNPHAYYHYKHIYNHSLDEGRHL